MQAPAHRHSKQLFPRILLATVLLGGIVSSVLLTDHVARHATNPMTVAGTELGCGLFTAVACILVGLLGTPQSRPALRSKTLVTTRSKTLVTTRSKISVTARTGGTRRPWARAILTVLLACAAAFGLAYLMDYIASGM